MSSDLAALADQFAAEQSGEPGSPSPSPAPAPRSEPGSPPSPLADLADQFAAARRAQAAAVNVVAQMGDADKAARAQVIGQQLGLPSQAVLTDLPGFEQRLAIRTSGKVLDQSPGLVDWMVANPDKAVLAKDDLDQMSTLSRLATSARAGWGEAFQPPKSEADAFHPSGIAGTGAYMLGSVAGFLTEAYGSPEAAAGAAGGAAIGALAGPAAPVSTPAAAWIGWQAGAISHVIQSQFRGGLDRAAEMRDQNGMPLAEPARVGLATVNAAVQGVMTRLGGGIAAQAVEDALFRAAERPTVAAALAGYGAGIARSAAGGAAIGGGVAGIQVAADQLARALSDTVDHTDFRTMLDDPRQIGPAVEQVVGEALKWAAFGGAMHSAVGLVGLGKDVVRARQSDARVQTINALLDGATDSKLRSRDPDSFREFMQAQTEGGPVENLEIPVQRIMELYQGLRVDPFALDHDPIFSWDPQWQDKLREAQAINGDVRVSTADYAAHLAGTDIDAALRPDLKPEGGISLRERDAHIAEMTARYQDHLAELSRDLSRETEPGSAREAVYRDAYTRLMAEGGMTVTEADHNAKMVAAHYAARADLWNRETGGDVTDAWSQYQRQSIAIRRQGDLTPLGRVTVNQLDSLINDLRAGRKGTQRELFGPGLTEWLAANGGLAPDPGGELKARDLDRWHLGKVGMSRLVKDGGRTLEDAAQAAADNGFLPEVKRALDAGEPIDLERALLAALDRDRTGHGVRSELLANADLADHARMLDDILRVIDESGLSLATADNATIKAALARHQEGATELYQPAEVTGADGRSGKFDADLKFWRGGIQRIVENRITDPLRLGKRFAVLRAMGIEDKGIELDSRAARKMMDDHPAVPRAVWDRLPELVADPLYVYPHKSGGVRVVLDAVTADGHPVVAGIGSGRLHTVFDRWEPDETGPLDGLYQDLAEALRRKEKIYSRDGKVPGEVLNAVRPAVPGTAPEGAFLSRGTMGTILSRDEVVKRGPISLFYQGYRNAAADEVRAAGDRLGYSETDLKEAIDVIEKIRRGEDDPAISDDQHAEITRLLDVAGRQGDRAAAGNDDGARTFDQRPDRRAAGGAGSDPQGSIRILGGEPGSRLSAIITLFRGADRSTFMHESAHLWLEELRLDAADPEAPPAFRDELGRVTAWLGIEHPDQIGTLEQEKFARAFEAYLMEGKAPSIELADTFARFKSWLLHIYRTLAGLDQAAQFDVRLDPEIRGVFDRMLASEDEITLARDQLSLHQLFRTAEDANMSPEQFAAYLKAVSIAKAEPVARLERKMITAFRREKEEWWKDESARLRAEVEAEIDARPDIQAWQAYMTGQLPDGRSGQVPKMNRDALVRMYGSAGILKDLTLATGRLYAARGGVHPDLIAEMFGLRDGRALIDALMTLKRQEADLREEANNHTLSVRRGLVDRETRARMIERHGDMLRDGSIVDEALDALHTDHQGEVLAAELAGLRSRARSVTYQGQRLLVGAVKPVEIAKAHAEATIAAKTVAEVLHLTPYARAEARAGKAAETAILKGDYPAAALAKEQQLLAHALWRAARDARDRVERDQTYLRKMAARPTIKGLDQEYLDQIHALLEQYEFRPLSASEIGRRQSRAEWIQRQEEAGAEVMISDTMRDEARRRHYSKLTVADLGDLADAVRNIEHLGKLKDKLLTAQKARDLQEAKDWLTDTAFRHPQRPQGPEMVKYTKGGLVGMLERVGQKARAINAPLMKIEQMCLMLDGGDSQGAWNTLIFRPMKDALFRRFDFENRIVTALRQLRADLPKGWEDGLGPHDFLPGEGPMLEPDTGQPARLRRKDLIAMMLNMGNDGNFNRLTEGYGGARNGWTRDAVRAFVDRHATEHDWRFVQGVWDIFESFRAEIGAMQKRLSGVEPEWVKAVPIETRFGQQLRGGYFPVMYDLTRSPRADELANRGAVQSLFGGNYNRATTPKGHTKARAENYSAPLDLNAMDLMGGRMAQHIHDLAFREAVMDVHKLISDPAVRKAVTDSLGFEYNKEFAKWLSDAASDRNIDPRTNTGMDRFLKQARINMTAVGIGWRFTTFAKHGLGALFNSIGELGPRWMAVGTRDLYGDPTRTLERIEEIKAKSPEMRYRKEQYDRDVMANMQDLVQHVGLNNANGVTNGFVRMRDWWNHAGHWLVSEGDWLSALPTWQGAYRKAQFEGLNEADSVYAADQAVRRAHGAQSLIDRAGIQRRSELWNCLTMFYGFFNHIWNRQVDMVDRAKWGIEKARMGDHAGARADFAAVAWRAMFYTLVPSLITATVIDGLPDTEDGDSWWGWTATAVAEELMAGVPILRDLGKYAIQSMHGEHRGLSVTPLTGAAETLVNTAYDLSAVFDEDRAVSDKILKKLITSAGIVSGVGTGAPAMYAQYVWDVLAGREQPEDAAEFAKNLLFGVPK